MSRQAHLGARPTVQQSKSRGSQEGLSDCYVDVVFAQGWQTFVRTVELSGKSG